MQDLETLNFNELPSRFPHRWLAVKVLERDPESGQPEKVRVVSRDADIYGIRINLGRDEYCIVYTGTVPEEKYVAML